MNLILGAGSSYKKERDAKVKSLSSSGHNWNTLFLGQNAVVDALAERLNTEKSKILEAETSDSLAVRMALGETQLVAETREFLTSNGVRLDVFGQVIFLLWLSFLFLFYIILLYTCVNFIFACLYINCLHMFTQQRQVMLSIIFLSIILIFHTSLCYYE